MDTTSRPSFPEPERDPAIRAVIYGPVHGQVAIGQHIYQNMWHIHGDVIVRAVGTLQPPRARVKPVYQLPRVFPGFLDRQTETSNAVGALMVGEPVNVHGKEGVGKTSLLRSVSHHEAARSFRDGVIWIRASAHPAIDLLQVLFEAFYEWDVSTKPTEGQLRQYLRSVQALVVCDDIQLSREDLEMVLDTVPECSFLVSAGERVLWNSGRSVSLSGLPLADAETLVERELGRKLTHNEREALSALHSSLSGHPLQLFQAAALVRSGDRDFVGLASDLRSSGPVSAISDHLVATLSGPERQMLAAVTAFAGAPVRSPIASLVTGIPEPEPLLEALIDRHLVIRKLTGERGEGYASVGMPVAEHLPDMDLMRERALETVTTWTEEHRTDPSLLLQDSDAVLAMVKWAEESGRWTYIVRLGRAFNGALALGLRWGRWSVLLGATLQAARALDSPHDIAWTRHQMGTRALCMGNERAARAALMEALRIRLDLDDREGAAVTRHNLDMLTPPLVSTEPAAQIPVPEHPPTGRKRSLNARLPIIAILLAVMSGGGWFFFSGEDREGDLIPTKGIIDTPTSAGAVLEPSATDTAVITVTSTDPPPPSATEEPDEPVMISLSLNDQNKVYGNPDPELTYSVNGGDGGLTFTGAPERDPGEGVGSYAIKQGSLAISQPGYTLNVVEGTFTIVARPVTVTADNQSKTIDTPDPPLTFSVSGGNGEVPTSGALMRDPGEEAGSYTIRQGTLSIPDSNYAMAFVEGTLTITEPPSGEPNGDVTIPARDIVPEETQVFAPPNESEPSTEPEPTQQDSDGPIVE